MSEYYTLITTKGQTDLVAANVGGSFVALTHMALGDGNGVVYNPVETATALVNERHRMAINRIYQHEVNANWLVIEGVLQADVGGWYIREVGIFDADGDLFAIAKYPETYKAVTADGVGTEINIKIILVFDNIGDVQLSIDPSVVYATQAWVIAYHDANWVQSDWDEANYQAKAYIRNKPGIPSWFDLDMLRRIPIFPKIEATDRLIDVTNNGNGTITVNGGQLFTFNGWERYSTEDILAAARTFALAAGKTYHLRFYRPGHGNAPIETYPAGRWMLRDLADAAYNPVALAEYESSFDTTLDDMLAARVVTDLATVATIYPLMNDATLQTHIVGAARNHTGANANHYYDFTIAWSRTPEAMLHSQQPPGNSYDTDYNITPLLLRREAVQVFSQSWHHVAPSGQAPGFNFVLRA